MSLNRAIVMGRITRDPELKRTTSGVPVTSFTLAVDRNYKSEGANRETDFIDVVAWRGTAEFVCNYFRKGRMMIVEGRLQNREWKDKDGNNRRNNEIIADGAYFGDSNKREDKPESDYSAIAAQPAPLEPIEDSGELPF